ncbi:MAG: hypothetical protein ABW138_04695, partial [Candidatus Thiodiazotropha sp. 4PDIVS1]
VFYLFPSSSVDRGSVSDCSPGGFRLHEHGAAGRTQHHLKIAELIDLTDKKRVATGQPFFACNG